MAKILEAIFDAFESPGLMFLALVALCAVMGVIGIVKIYQAVLSFGVSQ